MNTENEGKHALCEVVIAAPWNWRRWKKEWDKYLPLDVRISMLHSIYARELSESEFTEATCLLLKLADGYDRSQKIGHPNDWPGCIDCANRNKYSLGTRAMIVLCNEFFVNRHIYKFIKGLPYKELLFSKLLWFFRRRDLHEQFSNLHPITQRGLGGDKQATHYLCAVQEFAKRFAITAWDVRAALSGKVEEDFIEIAEISLSPHWKAVLELMDRLDLLDHLTKNVPSLGRYDQMVQWLIQTDFPRRIAGNSKEWPSTLEEVVKHKRCTRLAEVLWTLAPRINAYEYSIMDAVGPVDR